MHEVLQITQRQITTKRLQKKEDKTMNIQEMLRYSPVERDIIMDKDGSYYVIKTELIQGCSWVRAMHHINGAEPVEVSLNIPKVRAMMIRGSKFLVRGDQCK